MKKFGIVVPIAVAAAMWGVPSAHAGQDVTVTVTIGDDSVLEGTDSQAVVSVDLDKPAPAGGICVEVTEGDNGDTADPGSDYQFQTIDFSFAQGDSTAAAHINLVNDDISEDEETFTVKATQIACTVQTVGVAPGINAAVIVNTTDVGTVTVDDDDLPPTGASTDGLMLAGFGALGVGLAGIGASRVRRRPQTV